MGRPKKKINYELVLAMAKVFATKQEIASCLDVSVRTLERDEDFCRIYKKGLDFCRKSLREKQYELAMKGDRSMLIWLGKQYLGQSENKENRNVEETNGEQNTGIMKVPLRKDRKKGDKDEN